MAPASSPSELCPDIFDMSWPGMSMPFMSCMSPDEPGGALADDCCASASEGTKHKQRTTDKCFMEISHVFIDVNTGKEREFRCQDRLRITSVTWRPGRPARA